MTYNKSLALYEATQNVEGVSKVHKSIARLNEAKIAQQKEASKKMFINN